MTVTPERLIYDAGRVSEVLARIWARRLEHLSRVEGVLEDGAGRHAGPARG